MSCFFWICHIKVSCRMLYRLAMSQRNRWIQSQDLGQRVSQECHRAYKAYYISYYTNQHSCIRLMISPKPSPQKSKHGRAWTAWYEKGCQSRGHYGLLIPRVNENICKLSLYLQIIKETVEQLRQKLLRTYIMQLNRRCNQELHLLF